MSKRQMNVVITGCSRGIGLELVRLFMNKGHKVFALSRNVVPLMALEQNKNLQTLSFDLSNDSMEMLAKSIGSFMDSVDILINNAGLLINKPFGELSSDDFQSSYETNVFAPVLLIQHLQSLFSSKAHIINIGSMGGFQGSLKFPGLLAYSSAKGALACATECLQEEFRDTGWSFNCLCLGAVQTEMLSEAFPGYEAPHNSEEMAGFIYRFATTAGGFIKGKVLPVSVSTP